jgi:stage II sporulation protein D
MQEPIINVGIVAAKTIEFELKGDFLLGDKAVVKAGKYKADLSDGSICTSFAHNVECIKLSPTSAFATFVLNKVTIGIGFHWQQSENQEFEGELTFIIEGGQIRAINNIPLESYLKSVISSEMSAMNDPVLLQVHAIVSRSWLLAQIDKSKNKATSYHSMLQSENEIVKWYDREDHATFDVCADDHCQRYQGITKIVSGNAAKAVEATRGKIIAYNNKVCDARYSKCCGGISENFENVWQPEKIPYLTVISDFETLFDHKQSSVEQFILTKPDAFCNTADPEVLQQVLIDFDRATTNFFRWEVIYAQTELSQLLARKSGIDFGKIIDLIPLQRGPSGRITKLKIIGSKRSVTVGKELEIRKWLSESHLYSSAFVVEKNVEQGNEVPTSFKLLGAGWGHGVGMCQIGAAVMSRKGYSIEHILSHYFSGAQTVTIYPIN